MSTPVPRFPYPRTTVIALVLLSLGVLAIESKVIVESPLVLGLFEWMEETLFGQLGKTWGGLFAVVQAFHLIGMALLLGALVAQQLRWTGLLGRGISFEVFLRSTHSLLLKGLMIVGVSGIFMACGVAVKIYYIEAFWVKLFSLLVALLFYFSIAKPLMNQGLERVGTTIRWATAIASLMLWFTVAATGRWIGFS